MLERTCDKRMTAVRFFVSRRNALDQRFSNYGPRTTSGPRGVPL
jgi:hypothetical protein